MEGDFVAWVQEKLTGSRPRLEWYMDGETRTAVMSAAMRFGERARSVGYFDNRNAKDVSEACEVAIKALYDEICPAAVNDSWIRDPFFVPAVSTRLEAYLRVDGFYKRDIKVIVANVQNILRALQSKIDSQEDSSRE